MFIHSSLYNEMGKSDGLMDAKGISEFYLSIHTLKKVRAVLCARQTRITTLTTDTDGVSWFLVFHQVAALALLLGIILGKPLH